MNEVAQEEEEEEEEDEVCRERNRGDDVGGVGGHDAGGFGGHDAGTFGGHDAEGFGFEDQHMDRPAFDDAATMLVDGQAELEGADAAHHTHQVCH